MHDGLMNIIEDMSKVNRALVKALRDAHNDLEDMKEHVASITDPNPDSCQCSKEAITSVIAQDSQPETPEGSSPYPGTISVPEMFKELRSLVSELPESNAVFADRKWRLEWLAAQIHLAYNNFIFEQRALESQTEYEKSQTKQYQQNWEELSNASRQFASHFNREGMKDLVRIDLDDMLSKCEVESHNT